MQIWGTGGMSHQLQGPRAGLINKEWDNAFLDRLIADPDGLAADARTSTTCARPAREGIELVMWLIARGAMADVAGGPKPTVAHRFYHVPASQHGRRPSDPGEPAMSSKTIKVALAGAGAFGIKHLDGIKNIDGVEVVSLIGRELEKTQGGRRRSTASATSRTDLAESLALTEVDAVILCTPTQMHAEQTHRLPEGRQARAGRDPAGRHAWRAPRRSPALQKQTGLVAMVGHTRRFNPSHQWVHKRDRRPASSTSSRWTCRPTSSAART